MANGAAGVTPEVKAQLKRQFEARLKSRAQTRGASARRTGEKVKDVKGGVKLMPGVLRGKTRDKDISLTSAMRKHVTDLRKSPETATSYADSVKKAYAGAETDHRKSPLFGTGGKHKRGSWATGDKRKKVRSWSENIMSAYKKRKDSGNLTDAEFATKRSDVAKRRKHLVTPPKRT